MKRLYTTYIVGLLLMLLQATAVYAQKPLIEISGLILDKDNKTPLPGAIVEVKGGSAGVATDENGKFVLRSDLTFPFTLVVSYLGYEKVEVEVKDANTPLNIGLAEQEIIANEVVVSASRIEEDIQKSPVAIEKLDIKTIKASPAPTFYDALENVKGVQMTTSSINFKVPNTRGFNIPNNFRFMQLVDGVDMQSATLGVPLGNAIGPNELDIESVEITPGAASALYGMNAINGMANMQTKSAFSHQGLSVYQRIGVNHVDNIDQRMSPLSETAVRYAQAFNNKFAFKVNASYFTATDWVSNTRTDQNTNDLTSANPRFPQLNGANNPAYDGWTNYGNESNNNVSVTVFDPNTNKDQTFNVRRTGYQEKDLTQPQVRNVKGDVTLYYKITKDWEVSYGYRVGVMDGTFQRGNKIRLQGATVQNHKIELKGKRLLYRSYVSIENTGNSYGLKPLADNLELTSGGSNAAWTSKFQTELQSELNSGVALAQAMRGARAVADAGRVQPGTQAFQDLKGQIIGINNWDQASNVAGAPPTGGAALKQMSRYYHSDLQYNLAGIIKPVDVLIGGDYRVYEIIPDGNNYVDFSKPVAQRSTPGGNNVYYTKFGGFLQVSKTFFDKLKLVGSIRYDKNLDFQAKINPRAAIVYTIKEKHNLRASFQNGYRFPALFEALSYVNNGGVRRVGGLAEVNNGLGYLDNSYTLASLNNFTAAVNTDVSNGYNRNQAALKERNLLVVADLQSLKPEQITSYEIGYKSVLFNNKLSIDWDGYYNIYKNFLGQVDVATPVSGHVGSDAAVFDMLQKSNQTRYRVYTNGKNTYTNYGSSIGLTYNFYKKYVIGGNANYNTLQGGAQTTDVFVTAFNTPTWITNVSFGNRELFKNFGFNVVWKWQETFYWQSPLANGQIPDYHTVDAQFNYRVPKYFATVKIGGTNILNNRYIQYAAGPTIGAIYYVAITIDPISFAKKK